MEFDYSSSLWHPGSNPEHQLFDHYPLPALTHLHQVGGSCVSTGLSQLTNEPPEYIRTKINTQHPGSWSDYLSHHGFRLAYCATDLRKLIHYANDIIASNGLFAVSTYSSTNPLVIADEPDESGWITGSHFFLVRAGIVFDTATQKPIELVRYPGLDRYVKRIFRIVPTTLVGQNRKEANQ